MAHFAALLKALRRQHPLRRRRKPRLQSYPYSHCLEVWDLRQFRVSWREIARRLPPPGRRADARDERDWVESIRNAGKMARLYIDQGKWAELALYVEDLE